METPTGVVHDPDSSNHFEVMGIPKRLIVDHDELSRRFYELSREHHPDFHQTGSAAERLAAVSRTASLNAAYRTLGDPVALGRWWLEQKADSLGSGNNRVSPDLMMTVMEVQEQLEAARATGDAAGRAAVEAQLADVKREHAARMDELRSNFESWDALGHDVADATLLADLKRILSEVSYLATLKRDVETTLEMLGAK